MSSYFDVDERKCSFVSVRILSQRGSDQTLGSISTKFCTHVPRLKISIQFEMGKIALTVPKWWPFLIPKERHILIGLLFLETVQTNQKVVKKLPNYNVFSDLVTFMVTK